MEIPNNAVHEEIMDFKKFAQSVKGLLYTEEKIWIECKFKEEGSEEIIDKDDFWANKVHTSNEPINAEEIYKAYLGWFNYTLRKGEKPRIFVSAKFGKQEEEEE